MNIRWHSRMARALIDKCGGIDEAEAVCSKQRSSLSNYQNPNVDSYMPPHVMIELQTYCGENIYSDAISECCAPKAATKDLCDEVFEVTEHVASLQRAIRLATKDGRLTPNEVDRLSALHRTAQENLRDVGDALAKAAN